MSDVVAFKIMYIFQIVKKQYYVSVIILLASSSACLILTLGVYNFCFRQGGTIRPWGKGFCRFYRGFLQKRYAIGDHLEFTILCFVSTTNSNFQQITAPKFKFSCSWFYLLRTKIYFCIVTICRYFVGWMLLCTCNPYA